MDNNNNENPFFYESGGLYDGPTIEDFDLNYDQYLGPYLPETIPLYPVPPNTLVQQVMPLQPNSFKQPLFSMNSFDSNISDVPSHSTGRKSSLNARERRRERNKILARKTRQKKKAEIEGLRNNFLALKVENEKLKEAIKTYLPSEAAKILLEFDLKLPENVQDFLQQLILLDSRTEMDELKIKQQAFYIASPLSVDCPIIYVSPGFISMTGYHPSECIGKNIRFLQGQDTDKNEAVRLNDLLANQHDVRGVLLNYGKDGVSFWNRFEIGHLRDESHQVKFVVGIISKCDEENIRTIIAEQRAQYSKQRELVKEQDGNDTTIFVFEFPHFHHSLWESSTSIDSSSSNNVTTVTMSEDKTTSEETDSRYFDSFSVSVTSSNSSGNTAMNSSK